MKLSKDQIIKMAREVGIVDSYGYTTHAHADNLARFAELVAKDQIEKLAQHFDSMHGREMFAITVAAEIRESGKI